MKRHGGRSDSILKKNYADFLDESIRLFEEAMRKNATYNHTDELVGLIFDDSEWTSMLKKVSPKYASYEPYDNPAVFPILGGSYTGAPTSSAR